MTVKESITSEMFKLSKKKDTVFLGENIINSGRIYDTLSKVPTNKCIETPVAENLIAGVAIGLSLRGYVPIAIFQRMDFMLIAADAIINHASVYPKYGIKCGVVFRTIKASLEKNFFVGYQHSKDLSHVFAPYIKVIQVPECKPKQAYDIAYDTAKKGVSTLVVEDYQRMNETL